MPQTINPNSSPSVPTSLTVPANGDQAEASSVNVAFQSLLDGITALAGTYQIASIRSGLAGTDYPSGSATTNITGGGNVANTSKPRDATLTQLVDLGVWSVAPLEGDVALYFATGTLVGDGADGQVYAALQFREGTALLNTWDQSDMRTLLPKPGTYTYGTTDVPTTVLLDTYTYPNDTTQSLAGIRLSVSGVGGPDSGILYGRLRHFGLLLRPTGV